MRFLQGLHEACLHATLEDNPLDIHKLSVLFSIGSNFLLKGPGAATREVSINQALCLRRWTPSDHGDSDDD